ncbi:MAG: T9SS type A sorting domain-containing protein, partial [Flavobacterium sp.]
TGIFPATFTNIVSAAPATSSPVSATLPNLPVGNYLLRVVHLSEGLTLTVSTDDANGNGADNGSFVSVKALPTLSGVQATSVCAGNDSQITFSGLLPSTEVMVNYTVGGSANNVTVTADVAGTASFALLLDNATNGQVFTATSIARTDVTPSCTSTFNISTTLSVAANTWLGTTTVWNEAANWSCGNVPTAADNVVIAQTANQPIVSGDITAFANNLTANAGALLTVQSGNVLTVRNAVNVTSGGEIVFENNAHLMQDTNAVANANSGTVEVNRNSSLLFRQDYTMWSSPVAGQNLRDFSPETVLSRFYSYNTATDHYESIFITEQAADNVNFATGTGYLVRMPNGAPQAGYVEGTTAIKFAGQFTGTPHNGTIATAVTPQAGDLDGFNAIGNPYPSPISIPAFFAGNEGNTDGTIYLWRKKNGVDVQSAYCTVNADGDFVSNLQAGSESPNGILQTGQGFIVKALTSTVNFTNAMRSATTTQDDSFFRMNNSAPVTAESHRIWLNLSKDATPVAQMLVGYKSNATMGIDTGIDALFMNDVSTGLNSVIEGNAYAIQGRSLPFDNTDVVPLQFKAQAAGNYSVAIDHVDGLFADGQDIFLKDNLLNVTHDIKASSYSFTSDAGVFDNRFEMVYINTALGNEEVVLNPKSIIIYKQDRNLVVNAGSEIISEVKVFDTRGRMIYNNDSINSNETVVSGLRAEEQVLIVQVTTVEKGVVSKKIIF